MCARKHWILFDWKNKQLARKKAVELRNINLLQTLKNYKKENLAKDILAGIIIMAVSIPISMGYAQIAGLPPVYGLYALIVSMRKKE
jgi:hypothetical protein